MKLASAATAMLAPHATSITLCLPVREPKANAAATSASTEPPAASAAQPNAAQFIRA